MQDAEPEQDITAGERRVSWYPDCPFPYQGGLPVFQEVSPSQPARVKSLA